MTAAKSIGIFDSGFGGLTVMRALHKILPNEHLIYFGDTARAPYGNKSVETLLRYSKENAEFLKSLGIKILVVACNTACVAALNALRDDFPFPIVGISEQGAEEMCRLYKKDTIALLGTRATIASGIYQQNILKQFPKAQIQSIACPLFVSLIEEGYIDHPLTTLCAQEYLAPLKDLPIEAVLLGCSHYSLIEPILQKQLGSDVLIIDPATACAEKAKQVLLSEGLLNNKKPLEPHHFYVSEDPLKFDLLGKLFFDYPIKAIVPK